MPRNRFCLGLCATLALAMFGNPIQGGDEERDKIVHLLKVQEALRQGQEHLQRGHYQAAIYVLEGQLGLINGNKDYLRSLREAYLGRIRELQQANQLTEAAIYSRRLECVDPGALLELKAPAAAVVKTPPAPAPVPSPAPNETPALPVVKNPPSPAVAIPTPAPEKTPAQPVAAVLAAGSANNPENKPAGAQRAKIDHLDEDPFADANIRKKNDQAVQVIQQADAAFGAKAYEAALKLYEQAHSQDRECTTGCLDRWAYCKLFLVVQRLNRDGTNPGPAHELEQEIRQAMSMSPKMESFGKDLLRQVKDRLPGGLGSRETPAPTGSIPNRGSVKHTPRQGNAWALAETVNFRVFHNQRQEVAEQVAQIAEETRSKMSRKWFGQEDGAPWSPRCDIYLHPTAADYSRATSQPGECPGHSTISAEGERVLARRIDLHCDVPTMLEAILPHEATHVILAGHFPGHLPRWADEGMAVLTEPRKFVENHLRNLPRHRSQGQLFTVDRLMQMNDYPEPRLVGAFYAQSISLVDYLSQLRGPVVFSQFVSDGMRTGYEGALKRHYGLQGFADLQQRWQSAVLSDAAVQAGSGR